MTVPRPGCPICGRLIMDLEPYQMGLDGEAVHVSCLKTEEPDDQEDDDAA